MDRRIVLSLIALTSTTAFAGYGASSEKRDPRFGEGAFSVARALDSDPATAWQSNPEKDNVGQWIQIDVPTAGVDKIAMIIGWAKSEETFKDYARVKAATVEVFSKGLSGEPTRVGEAKIQFKDEMGWQVVDIDDLKISGELGGFVKITVDEVYPGVDYPNLAVGDVRIHLTEFPAETLALADEPEAVDEAHGASKMLDGRTNTYFLAKSTPVRFTATAKGYGISSVGIQPGPSAYARPKTVVLKANDAEVTHTIPEGAKGMQWLLLPVIVGYTGSAWGDLTVEIVDTWPGTKPENPLAIAELKLNASTLDDF